MKYENKKYHTGIITLRVFNIVVVLLSLYMIVGGTFGIIKRNYVGYGYIFSGLFLLCFSYWLLEYNGVQRQFIKQVDILNDRIIFYYHHKKKKIIIPYNTINSKKITEKGAIWYYSSINQRLSYDFREGLISSTLLEEKIFKKFEESLNNYLEKRNIKLHEK